MTKKKSLGSWANASSKVGKPFLMALLPIQSKHLPCIGKPKSKRACIFSELECTCVLSTPGEITRICSSLCFKSLFSTAFTGSDTATKNLPG